MADYLLTQFKPNRKPLETHSICLKFQAIRLC